MGQFHNNYACLLHVLLQAGVSVPGDDFLLPDGLLDDWFNREVRLAPLLYHVVH